MDGPKLIFWDAVRAAKVVRLGVLGWIQRLAGIPQISKNAIDLFLRKNAVESYLCDVATSHLSIG